MYKKTVLHRLCKHIEIDFDSPEQYRYFNEDLQIASVEEQVANDISENANKTEFVMPEEVVVDAEVVETTDVPEFMK